MAPQPPQRRQPPPAASPSCSRRRPAAAMSWLKKDLALLSRTAEEEFYEALAQAHDRGMLRVECRAQGADPRVQTHQSTASEWHDACSCQPLFCHLSSAQAMALERRSMESGCMPARRAAVRMAWRCTGVQQRGRAREEPFAGPTAVPAPLPASLSTVHTPSCRPFFHPLYVRHRAAFEGNLEELAHLLPSLSLRQKLQLDSQGNTVRLPAGGRAAKGPGSTHPGQSMLPLARGWSPFDAPPPHALTPHMQALHVAVLRRQYGAIHALLEAGVPADVKSERMWSPIDEAVALRDAEGAKILYTCVRVGPCWQQEVKQIAASWRGSTRGLGLYQLSTFSPTCPQSAHATRRRLLAGAKKAKRAKKEQLVKIMQEVGAAGAASETACCWQQCLDGCSFTTSFAAAAAAACVSPLNPLKHRSSCCRHAPALARL